MTSQTAVATNGWRAARLKELVSLEYGSSLSGDARAEGSVPVFGSNGRVGSHSTALVKGPGIIVGRKGSIGRVVWAESDFWPIDTTYYVQTDQDLKFMYYLLSSLGLDRLNRSTGVPGLNREDAYALKVTLPPRESQRRIAAILTESDRSIAATDAVITESERLKTALLNQLLTRGIGHTKFKQTEIGEIPESWSLGNIKDLTGVNDKNSIKPGPFGSSLRKAFYVKDGYKVYGQEQVIADDPYKGDYFVDEVKYAELSAFKVSAGDILISLVGTIGKVLIVPDDFTPGVINPRLIKITLDRLKATPKFVKYLLQSRYVISQIEGNSHGGTMNILNKKLLEALRVAIPALEEQRRIARVLDAVQDKIEASQRTQLVQKELRRGLMQDLLGGKVTV